MLGTVFLKQGTALVKTALVRSSKGLLLGTNCLVASLLLDVHISQAPSTHRSQRGHMLVSQSFVDTLLNFSVAVRASCVPTCCSYSCVTLITQHCHSRKVFGGLEVVFLAPPTKQGQCSGHRGLLGQ